jgi:hypothetical protein
MNYGSTAFSRKGSGTGSLASLVLICVLLLPSLSYGDGEFSFDLEEIEKKSFQTGGFLEFRGVHIDINQGSIFSNLNLSDPDISTMDQIFGSVQLDGSYEMGATSLNWTLKAAAQQDTLGWSDMADVFSAYLSVKPSPSVTFALGKKSYKWGKGYAWNPVGFINRPKDPNNPEEALEGYITAEGDFIKSYSGALKTAALTLAVLPVWENINEDFGTRNNVNLAARLYLLYFDTDIDLLFLSGNSRSNRFGIDFSTNLATNFEIHGELAYIPELKKTILADDNSSSIEEHAAVSTLIGLRYLFANDVTAILEYYYNGGGYSEEEMDRFYLLAETGFAEESTVGSILLDKARNISLKGYGRPQPGRQYLYAKVTQKEPFDILYFTPGITTIFNLEDTSYSISPDVVYSGLTNWEFRLRFSLIGGRKFTEFGEKINSNKIEIRARYFF